MGNGALLSWINYVDDASAAAASFSGSDVVLTAAANVLDRQRAKRFRIEEGVSGGASTMGHQVTWSTAQDVDVVGAFGLMTSVGVGTVYLHNFEYLNSSDTWTNISLANTTAQWAPAASSELPWQWIIRLDATVQAKGIRVEWILPALGDWAEVGYMWAGPALILEGFEVGWDLKWRDHGKVNGPNPGGQKYPDRRSRYRVLTVSLPDVESVLLGDESTLGVNDMLAAVGRTSDVLALPRTSSKHVMHCAGVLGLLDTDSGIQHQNGSYFRTQLVIEEQV